MAVIPKLLSPLTNLFKAPTVPAATPTPQAAANPDAPAILRRNLTTNQVPTIFGGQYGGRRNFLGG